MVDDLDLLPYLGPEISEKLHWAMWGSGFDTLEKVQNATIDELMSVDGIGEVKAKRIKWYIEACHG